MCIYIYIVRYCDIVTKYFFVMLSWYSQTPPIKHPPWVGNKELCEPPQKKKMNLGGGTPLLKNRASKSP